MTADSIQQLFCPGCSQSKPTSEFHKNRSARTGFAERCKSCKSKQRQQYRAFEVTVTEKECIDCREVKPAGDFPRSTHRKDGLFSRCRPCTAIQRKAYATSPRGKEVFKRIQASEHHRRNRIEQQRRYQKTEHFKALRKRPLTAVRIRRNNLRSTLKRIYGLTLEQYEHLLEQQGRVCAICGGPQVGKKRLAVDHDHKTGALRGLLCSRCNTGLGAFLDSPLLLTKAKRYLKFYSQEGEVSSSRNDRLHSAITLPFEPPRW